MTIGEMMSRMSAREYDDWMAYMQLYPLGERALDYRFGMLTLPVVNALRDQKTRPRPVEFDDLYPWNKVAPAPVEETQEQQAAGILAMFAVHGLVIDTRKKADA